ncbi:nucleotide sugar dehydrogenase [Leucobacter denitrificans]|uniref:Nucleotide sugar dehydrogenase n=1 Tax=Leucobacter denitrificans TaxID=683042 RepID=A0A7G9S789_9MICO|nr:nucleotide sugar dehydrogenase [Leucobacter denitrificans]QNN63714.1 nucleotide sugar dehydrogenase [Leucobacter denitrificans]
MDTEPQKLVVIGQGYVGLPVAMRAVKVGFNVVGLDLDSKRVAGLRSGESYVDDVSSEELAAAVDSQNYVPSEDYAAAEGFDIAVITVPTPLKESLPDLSFVESSARSLAEYLSPGATVVLESTTYPGTTEELLVPILEEVSGLKVDQDFYVGYSPERIDPGNKTWGFVETPKVVSGTSPISLEKVQEFYDRLVDTTVAVSGTREAELTKLLENTFRHVNIALVNELAVFAHQLGVNVWESIEAASTKPFGFMEFTPGPGVGGHCLPVDPSYLSWEVRRKLGRSFRFVELANDVNEHMPDYVVSRLTMLLNQAGTVARGATVLLVGLAYKRGTGDTREAPSLRIIDLLRDYGVNLIAFDSYVEPHRWPEGVERVGLDLEALERADAVVLITDHDDVDLRLIEGLQVPVLDTKNVLRGPAVERL